MRYDIIRLGDEGEMVASRIKSRPEWLFSSVEKDTSPPRVDESGLDTARWAGHEESQPLKSV